MYYECFEKLQICIEIRRTCIIIVICYFLGCYIKHGVGLFIKFCSFFKKKNYPNE